jgi:hypothetical protein
MLILIEIEMRTMFTAMLGTGNLKFDKDLPIHREMVELSREIITARKSFNQCEFSCEVSIVPALGIVARWCRDRALRREAISLLRWYGTTEGIWDGPMMAEMSDFHMRAEEEGVDTEFIPESARVRSTGLVINQQRRVGRLQLIRGTKETGETRLEATVHW